MDILWNGYSMEQFERQVCKTFKTHRNLRIHLSKIRRWPRFQKGGRKSQIHINKYFESEYCNPREPNWVTNLVGAEVGR